MDAPLASFYKHDWIPAPDIKVRFSVATQAGRRAVDAFDGGCLGLDLVRTDDRHVVAVLRPGEALRLKR